MWKTEKFSPVANLNNKRIYIYIYIYIYLIWIYCVILIQIAKSNIQPLIITSKISSFSDND